MSATHKHAWRMAPHIHNPGMQRGIRAACRPLDPRGQLSPTNRI